MQNSGETVPHQIVIVGGGAGGLELASRLGRSLGKKGKAHILLIDRSFNHIWKPLLHEVAAGTLDTHHAEVSYLDHARRNGFSFWPGEFIGLDSEAKTLKLASQQNQQGEQIVPSQKIKYDTLILAVGSQTHDFNTPGAREHGYFIDDRESAETFNIALREAILKRAAQEDSQILRIAIVGAGATGVELAAELSHLLELVAGYGFPKLRDCLELTLIEGTDHILNGLPLSIAMGSHQVLEKLGIRILTQTRATAVDAQGIHLENGQYLPADLKVWAAGVKAPSFLKHLDGLETNAIGQLLVNKKLQTTQDPCIFAIGDCAQLATASKEALFTPTAQVAHQQATYLAKALPTMLKGKKFKPFQFHYLGSLISLSRYNAFGRLGRFGLLGGWHISGVFARFNYTLLYRLHQLILHGVWRTLLLIISDKFHELSKPPINIP